MKRTTTRRAVLDRVRPVRRGDRRAVTTLWADADRLHAELHPSYFFGDGRLDARLDKALERESELRELYVAERGTMIVGFVLVEILEPSRQASALRGRRGHIDTLVVAEGARRAGCGRRLLEAAAAWARARRAEELLLTVWAGNDDAERFYEHLGLTSLSRVMKLSL